MIDRLLFKPTPAVPLDVILRTVSSVTNIPVSEITTPSKISGAKKGEKVNARQLSMKLSKDMSRKSLAAIGSFHGNYDHATVLHACKAVNNFLDIKDPVITAWYTESMVSLNSWRNNHIPKPRLISTKEKLRLLRIWTKHKVPLDIRWNILQNYNRRCPECGAIK